MSNSFNTKDTLSVGNARYEIHRVGGIDHTEWWIPAEDLNANIVGLIEVVEENSRYSVLKLRLAVS